MEEETAAEAVNTSQINQPLDMGAAAPWDTQVAHIPFSVVTNAPFPHRRLREIPHDGDTEDLLNGLIAECHFMLREVALPSAIQVCDATTHIQLLNTAMLLAETGAKVGRVVAKLRSAGAVTEFRQRHILEQSVATPAAKTENGAKT